MPQARTIQTLIRRLWPGAREGQARPVFSVDVDANTLGLFAQINWLYQLTQYAEQMGLDPDIWLVADNYADNRIGPNWFGYFFDYVGRSARAGRWKRTPRTPIRIRKLTEIRFPAIPDLPRRDARDLFFRHYAIKPVISKAVNAFCAANGIDDTALAVHYRGTDKTLEAARVPYEAAITRIRAYIAEAPQTRTVFVASDEAEFIGRCVAEFGDVHICFVGQTERSVDGDPLHIGRRGHDRYLAGKGAILDALIMARCGTIIRTASFLSAWACVLNPDLKVILLNRPYEHTTWFPESVILRDAVF